MMMESFTRRTTPFRGPEIGLSLAEDHAVDVWSGFREGVEMSRKSRFSATSNRRGSMEADVGRQIVIRCAGGLVIRGGNRVKARHAEGARKERNSAVLPAKSSRRPRHRRQRGV